MRKSDCIHTGKCLKQVIGDGKKKLDCTDCETYERPTSEPGVFDKPTTRKICTKCGIPKNLETGFWEEPTNKTDGHKGACIVCGREYERKREARDRIARGLPVKKEKPITMTPQGKVPKPQETPTPRQQTARGRVELDKLTLAIRIAFRIAGPEKITTEEAISRVYQELVKAV